MFWVGVLSGGRICKGTAGESAPLACTRRFTKPVSSDGKSSAKIPAIAEIRRKFKTWVPMVKTASSDVVPNTVTRIDEPDWTSVVDDSTRILGVVPTLSGTNA